KKQRELVAADAKGGVRGTKRFLQSGCSSAQNIVAARVTVLVVYLFEAVQVEGDQAERVSIAAGAVEFFVEGLVEKAPIVKASKRVGDRATMKILELVIFENDRDIEHSGGRQNVHERSMHGNGKVGALGKLRAARENFFPQGDGSALRNFDVR